MEKGSISKISADMKQTPVLTKVVLGVLAAAFIFVSFYHYSAMARFEAQELEMASTIATLEQKGAELERGLTMAQEENEDLAGDLRAEKRRNQKFSDQIEDIAGTVSALDKLRKTDSELLKKYSKIAFLNENYLPEGLSEIDKEFLSAGVSQQRFHAKAILFLEDLLEDAQEAKNELRIVSAYRSFGTQASLKSQYAVVYGSGANQFSADQGYSEHQLGTAIDWSTLERGTSLDGFETTTAYQWLLKNAHKYGFVLSYPPNNMYYQFEPWHWRFVGVDLASDLYKDKKYFYDLDQREIDAYLIKLFD